MNRTLSKIFKSAVRFQNGLTIVLPILHFVAVAQSWSDKG